MHFAFRGSAVVALVLLLLDSHGEADPTNIVLNGNFAGGTQQGPGNDTVANNWDLDPANITNFQIKNVGGTFYAVFMSPASTSDLANGNMNGIGVPNGQPDQDCFYQPINVIAGKQYTISFSVTITGAVGNNTLLIPQWNWSPKVGEQINMMDAIYGSYDEAKSEYSAATGTGSVNKVFTETAPVGDGVPAGSPEVVNLMFHGSEVSGGAIMLSNVVVTEAATSIFSGGVVAADTTSNSVESGQWVSIYGSNLASGSVTWTGNFPTSLGGSSVLINGKPAYLSFVSPGQINLQAPDDSATGPVPVTVTTSNGTAMSTVTLVQAAPSFLLLDATHVAGIILRADGSGAYGGGSYDVMGPTGTSLGYRTVAAKAGDIVELFGTGFGPTSPVVPAGQPYSGAAPVVNTVHLLVNNVNVTPDFAGLSSAGLDQINFTVPPGLGTGDVPLQVITGGAQTPSGPVVSLQ